MAKVVALTQTASGGYRLPEDVMNDLRWRMHLYEAKDLAERVGVSQTCIYSIKSGRTKWPRGGTLFGLLEALNLGLVLIDLKTGKPLRAPV